MQTSNCQRQGQSFECESKIIEICGSVCRKQNTEAEDWEERAGKQGVLKMFTASTLKKKRGQPKKLEGRGC